MANPNTLSTKQFGTEAKNKARDTASEITDKAKEVSSNMTEQARNVGSAVTQRAEDVAANIGHRAQEATGAVAGSMKSLAGAMREKMPHEGMMGRASTAVADSLERGGQYLKEEGLSGMANDLTNLIRRNPIPAVLAGIGIGFLIARATRR
jgi:hypothetical protein